MKNALVSLFVCLFASALLLSCGSDDMATVKIVVGLPSDVSVAPSQGGIIDRVLGLFETKAYAQAAPDDVSKIGVRVTGPGMTPLYHIFSGDRLVLPVAIKEGKNRRIAVFGIDTNGRPKYSGSTLVDLKAGTVRTVNIVMHDNLHMIQIDSGLPSNPSYMTFFKFKVYFQATNTEAGAELWAYDLETETASMVADINPGSGSSSPQNLTVFKGKLVFSATDGIYGTELWSYDGQTEPVRISDIITDTDSPDSNPLNLTVVGDNLFFVMWTDSIDGAPFLYNGTDAPYALDATYNIRQANSFTQMGDILCFAGSDYVNNDVELYVYDYVNPPVKIDIATTEGSSSSPGNLVVLDDKLFFSAADNSYDIEAYVYNGVDDPVKVDLWPDGSSSPNELTIVRNRIYFSALVSADANYQLGFYDESLPTRVKVRAVDNFYGVSSGTNTADLYAVGPVLFYTAQDPTDNHRYLWRHISINGATTRLTDFGFTDNSCNIAEMIVVGTNLAIVTPDDGGDLWIYDPLQDVKDADPLKNPYKLAVNSAGLSDANGVLAVGNMLFFSANDGSSRELWTYELYR